MTTLPPKKEEELDRFLHTLCANLGKAIEDKVVPPEWLCSTEGSRNYMLHSRVWGVLAKTGFELDYIVEVNAGFDAGGLMKQFKPDLLLWDSNRLRFLIEYEGTNSSDSRIIDKDLDHCYQALSAAQDEEAELPAFWLIIHTLPDHEVCTWSHWDYRGRSKAFEDMTQNPHRFYKEAFERPELLSGPNYPDRWEKPKISARDCYSVSDCSRKGRKTNREPLLVNLTERGLEMDFPRGLSKNEYLFEPLRSKR